MEGGKFSLVEAKLHNMKGGADVRDKHVVLYVGRIFDRNLLDGPNRDESNIACILACC